MSVFIAKIKKMLLFSLIFFFISCTPVIEKSYYSNTSSLEERMDELRSLLMNYQNTGIDLDNISLSIQDNAINISFQNNILFDLNKYKVKEKYKNILSTISNYLIDNPTLDVTIEGHTDNSGKKEYNLLLSEKRAKEVKNILENFAVNSDRISIIGYGEDLPLFDNNTRDGRKKNRRAEILLRENIKNIPLNYSSQTKYINNDNKIKIENLDNKKYAKYKAFSACAGVIGGCEIASQKVKGAFKEHGLAQGCALIESSMQGKDYGVTDIMKTALVTVIDSKADELIEEAGFWKGVGWGMRVGTTWYKLNAFNECTDTMEKKYLYGY